MHLLRPLIDLRRLLRTREPDIPIPRRRVGTRPAVPVPRYTVLVRCYLLFLLGRRGLVVVVLELGLGLEIEIGSGNGIGSGM